jgi:hypothetical protein
MKRLIAAFAAALMLAVGVPGVASASTNLTLDADWTTFYIGAVGTENTFTTSESVAVSLKVTDSFCTGDQVNIKIDGVSVGDSSDSVVSNCEEIESASYDFAYANCEWSSFLYTLPAGSHEIVVTTIASPYGDGASGIQIISDLSPSSPNTVCAAPPADPLTTSTPTLKRNGISFTPDNFDPTCAYEISTTAGTVKQNPVTGEVNVYGVGSGTSVTVTITDCTGATATVSGKATAATAAVQTLTKPTVAVAADLITCTAGTSTVNPTSIAYTLLVDGVAVSTRFSDGAIAPSLVATTAAQNLYSGATLSKATWTVDPAWAGKSYSCTTTSYAAGAVGIANS